MTKLTDIDEISEEDAEVLSENNIHYVGDLAGASCKFVEDLGFSPGIVAEALRQNGYGKSEVNHEQVGYTCHWCGREFHGLKFRSHEKHTIHECNQRPDAENNQFEEVVQ